MNGDIKIIVDTLLKYNFKLAFGISGSGISYQLIDSLVKNGIKYIPVSNESAAAIAAGAASYLNRNKALCITIKGPGFANLLSGITACYFEKFDIVSFSEDFDDSAPNTKQHKRLNQIGMVSPVVGKIGSFNTLASLEKILDPTPGNELPVHFELAKVGTYYERNIPSESKLMSNEEHTNLIKQISKSQKPTLIIGSLLYRLELTHWINKMNLPVFTTAQAKGILDETLPNSCGVFTGVGESLVPESEIITNSDCIITLGLRNYEILSGEGKKNFLNIDVVNYGYDSDTFYLNKSQIEDVLYELTKKDNWCTETIMKYRIKLSNYVDSYSWMPGQLFQKINHIDDDITLVLDTGTFCTIGEHVYLASKKKRFIGSSNGRNMGISVPMALGSVINSNPVICCCGDGGIRYHIGEIRTIVEMNLPVCIILISDRLYGSIACSIKKEELNPSIVQPLGMEWYKVFSAMDIKSGLAKTSDQFNKLFDSWDRKGPCFIETVFETKVYSELTRNIRK